MKVRRGLSDRELSDNSYKRPLHPFFYHNHDEDAKMIAIYPNESLFNRKIDEKVT